MDSINIINLNVHGLRNKMKRKTIFHNLRLHKSDIICLQETYITDNDHEQWEREWGGKIYYSSNTTHSMGQMILIKKKFPYETQCNVKKQRILIVEIKVEDDSLFIINAYGPNIKREKPAFFQQVNQEIDKLENKKYILNGDFNTVVDNELDIISGGKHDIKDVELFKTFRENNDLIDLWRFTHGDTKEYTWAKRTPFIARRLDYIFVPEEMIDKCAECEIVSVAQSDHRLLKTKLRLTPVQRGPSYWKFNENLLHDTIFVESMNELLENYNNEYNNLDKQIKWDYCKIKIREFCIAYSKQKILNKKKDLEHSIDKLNEIEQKIAREPENKTLLTQREQMKHKIELNDLAKAKSAQIRSREKFIVEGEKNTKYFLHLEKVRNNMKIMDKLKTEEGTTVSTREEISKEQVSFYKKVFTKNEVFDETKAENFTQGLDIPQLEETQRETLDSELLESEILAALKALNNNSAPGLDGLTTRFIQFFWLKLNALVVQSIQQAFVKGEMSESQRRAVITIIHKGKALPRDELKNWRPISLTNTDYKILAKCLASRLSKVIKNIINEDQVGFIKGRKSSTIIRLIDDTIDYMNNTNQPGIILALDYSRAFDSISKDFIVWSFKKFGFGENFVKWVKVINSNTESCINYCGWLSEGFTVETGIRQGCPFSPMTFILALEILALKIRNNDEILGIKLPNIITDNDPISTILKLAMYADDITMFLSSKQDLEKALECVNQFTDISYLKINTNKTEAMWIGSMKNSRETHFNLSWRQQLKILGIIFKNDTPASDIRDNWSKRVEKIEQIIKLWSRRNLSISGKICILRTFLISQVVYPMQALIAPKDILQQINTMLFRFLWKKKFSNTKAFEKVKRVVVCNKKEEGGLQMINIIDMQTSFSLVWIAQLKEEKISKWKSIPLNDLNKMGPNLTCLKASIPSNKLLGLNYIHSTFWKRSLMAWVDHKKLFIKEYSSFEHQPLFNNRLIKYRNNYLFFSKWVNAGVALVHDVWRNGTTC